MEQRSYLLADWSVFDGDRLQGRVYGHADRRDGTIVYTSRVARVALAGPEKSPVAFTHTGSAYRLGKPSDTFGVKNAEDFVSERLDAPPGAPGRIDDPHLKTTSIKLKDR